MQVTPLNSNHVTAHINANERALNGVEKLSKVVEYQDNEAQLDDPTRVEKIFNTLTRELSDREKDDRELALYKSMNPDYLDKEIPLYESQLIREKIEEEKSLKAQLLKSENEKLEKKEKSKEEFVQNNDAVNAQNKLELQSFVNDFYKLFNSGYTPIDLKI